MENRSIEILINLKKHLESGILRTLDFSYKDMLMEWSPREEQEGSVKCGTVHEADSFLCGFYQCYEICGIWWKTKREIFWLNDDCDRKGEQRTCQLIGYTLQGAGIPYFTYTYSGEKDVTIIVSQNLKFLCTM